MSGQLKISELCEMCGEHGNGRRELMFIEHLLCARHRVDMLSFNNQAKWVLLIFN